MSDEGLKHPAHDSFFQSMMTNKRVAEEFFNYHLPLPIRKLINLKSLELCKESYIDGDLKKSILDILYKVDFNDKPGYLYVISEHQSKIDPISISFTSYR